MHHDTNHEVNYDLKSKIKTIHLGKTTIYRFFMTKKLELSILIIK